MRKEGEAPRLSRKRRWLVNATGAASAVLIAGGTIDVVGYGTPSRSKAKNVAVAMYPVNNTELNIAAKAVSRYRTQVKEEAVNGNYERVHELTSAEGRRDIEVVEDRAAYLAQQKKNQEDEFNRRTDLGWRFIADAAAIFTGSGLLIGWTVWRRPPEVESKKALEASQAV